MRQCDELLVRVDHAEEEGGLVRVDYHRTTTLRRLASPQRSDTGVRYEGVSTRAGVFHYRRADGSIRREWRPWEWVSHPDSLASMQGKPVTSEHPRTPGRLLTLSSADRHSKGSTPSSRADAGEQAIISVLDVHSASLVGDIDSGRRQELSWGYTIKRLDETGGVTPEGEEYDAIQVGPYSYNHLAATREGRAGPTARIRADSYPGSAVQCEAPTTTPKGGTMLREAFVTTEADGKYAVREPRASWPIISRHDSRADANQEAARLMGDDAEAGVRRTNYAALYQAHQAEQQRADEARQQATQARADAAEASARLRAAEGERDSYKARAETAEGRVDSLKARVDSVSDDSIQKRVDEAAKERLEVVVKAMPMVAKDQQSGLLKLDSLDIMAQAIAGQGAKPEEVKALKDKGADYLKGRFDGLAGRYENVSRNLGALRGAGRSAETTPRADDNDRDQKREEAFNKAGENYKNF